MSSTVAVKRHFVATGYVVEDGKTLLVFHKKLRLWLAPGGHVDEGELPEETVLREVSEETGLTARIVGERRSPDPANGKVRYLLSPRHIQLEDIPGPGGFHQHIDLIYFCKAVAGAVRLAPEEHEDIRWFSETDLAGGSLGEALPEEVRETGALAIQALST